MRDERRHPWRNTGQGFSVSVRNRRSTVWSRNVRNTVERKALTEAEVAAEWKHPTALGLPIRGCQCFNCKKARDYQRTYRRKGQP